MESGRSSLLQDEVPDGDQLEARGSEPAASEAPGTPASSRLFKRDAPEAPEAPEEEEQEQEEEEEQESEGSRRELDLKEAYVQLVQGVQEWQDGCVYRGQFGLDMKLGYGEFSWPTGERSLPAVLPRAVLPGPPPRRGHLHVAGRLQLHWHVLPQPPRRLWHHVHEGEALPENIPGFADTDTFSLLVLLRYNLP